MFHLKGKWTLEDLKDYTVVLPMMATINASQLALDVLIASKKMEQIGQITDVALIPVYGPSPFIHSSEKASAAEIYALPEEKLLAIQFRSALDLRYGGKFLKNISKSFKEANVRQIIILSNSMSINTDDRYCYSATELFKKTYEQELSRMNWKEDDGSGILGLGSDKIFKALNPENIPVLIFYHNIPLPVDDIDDEYAVKELNELIVDFLKIGTNFKSQLPNYWKFLLDNEMVDMMMY